MFNALIGSFGMLGSTTPGQSYSIFLGGEAQPKRRTTNAIKNVFFITQGGLKMIQPMTTPEYRLKPLSFLSGLFLGCFLGVTAGLGGYVVVHVLMSKLIMMD